MTPNGANRATNKFDPNFTRNVINATGPKATPRTRKVLASLIQHLHDFARENEITVDEWMSAVEFVGATRHDHMEVLLSRY
jgi:catechol 1,2-dioxygenase